MKLIIDIDNRFYKEIAENPDLYTSILHKAIRNGIEVNENDKFEYVVVKTDALLSYIEKVRKENKNETGN